MPKMRGRLYRGGYHDFTIHPGGLRVFPRIIAAEHDESDDAGVLRSGVGELDAVGVAVSAALGPTLASAILAVGDWPYLFAVNIPFGIAALGASVVQQASVRRSCEPSRTFP